MIRRSIVVATVWMLASPLCYGTALGQWTADGAPLCTAPGSQLAPILVADGAGGAIAVWQDHRGGASEIYCLRIAGDGAIAAGWPADGVQVTGGGDPSGGVAVSDGAGGVVVAWRDTRATPGGRIYAQRLLASGARATGWPEGGAQVSVSSSFRYVAAPGIAPDGEGGAIVIYGSYYLLCTPHGSCSVTETTLLAERIGPLGTVDPPWSDGEAVLSMLAAPVAVVVTDGAGGAIAGWIQDILGGSRVVLQRVSGAGVVPAPWPVNGLALDDAPGVKNALRVAPDGAGGALIGWLRQNVISGSDLYAARVDSTGTMVAGWPAGGTPVCTAAGDQTAPDLLGDAAGGAILCWQDGRGGSADIYALHLDASGSAIAGWPPDGAPLCVAPGDQLAPRAASDGFGGAYAAWQDFRAGGPADIYAQHVTTGGANAQGWRPDGNEICTAPASQRLPVIAPDAAGGAVVAWEDVRGGPTCGVSPCDDIYAQRLVVDGSVAVRVSVVWSEVGVEGARIAWSLEPAPPGSVRIERAEEPGAWALSGFGSVDGTGRLEFTDRAAAAGRRFGYRLAIQEPGGLRFAGETWIAVPAATRLELAGPRPNPSSGRLRVSFALPGAGAAVLQLIDVAGRRLRSVEVGRLGPGRHSIEFGADAQIPAGVYRLRLSCGDDTITASVVVLK